jgi:hypothetical protein
MVLLIMKFSPHACYLIPLRPKYSLQHPILKHTLSTFLTQCQRPSFTPIRNENLGMQLNKLRTVECMVYCKKPYGFEFQRTNQILFGIRE